MHRNVLVTEKPFPSLSFLPLVLFEKKKKVHQLPNYLQFFLCFVVFFFYLLSYYIVDPNFLKNYKTHLARDRMRRSQEKADFVQVSILFSFSSRKKTAPLTG